ncbi:ATP-binding protein [Thiohalocapsa marina]|uniref:ATP-binding protein n=1 Tax=Thiohalocapsa marina TaxID=424902 RepID=A0A5M8FVC9_9GAMM|nr:ATP-binding protein [Thiohalocapsa marina]KAA6187756.1 ATP-binding protein [Thiohalocapsa marina]
MTERHKLVLKNDLSELQRLAQWLEACGEAEAVDPKTLFNFNLALDELVTNVVSYAYPEGGEHAFSVELWREGGRLIAMLVDDGVPFNPLEIAEPELDTTLDERKIGGLGVHFVRKLLDDVRYSHEDGRNHVRLMKHLSV